jgi:hypothetical protein
MRIVAVLDPSASARKRARRAQALDSQAAPAVRKRRREQAVLHTVAAS